MERKRIKKHLPGSSSSSAKITCPETVAAANKLNAIEMMTVNRRINANLKYIFIL